MLVDNIVYSIRGKNPTKSCNPAMLVIYCATTARQAYQSNRQRQQALEFT